MIIKNLKNNFEKNNFIGSMCKIDFNNNTYDIFYGVNEEFKDLLIENNLDCFLIGCLIPAMHHNEDIYLEGNVSESLLNNINNSKLQDIICTVIPACKKIKVHAKNTIKRDETDEIVLTGFSGGIDSFVTLEDYFLNTKSQTKITHLLFNNLIFKDELAENKFKFLKKSVEHCNLPFIKTYTNIHKLYERKTNFEQTHSIRNTSIPYMFKKNIKYLYSSSFPKTDAEIKKWPDISIANIFLFPLLSTETIEVIEVGNEYGRVEKTKIVIENPLSYNFLDICVKPKISKGHYVFNCSSCYKCMRALTTFDILGVLDNYKSIFNIEKYLDKKQEYLESIRSSSQLNDVDLVKFMDQIDDR